jgi:hypothetical protein
MTTDRTTKALLLAIALGLWANVAGDWLKPAVVHAQGSEIYLAHIAHDVLSIASGSCTNQKICG